VAWVELRLLGQLPVSGAAMGMLGPAGPWSEPSSKRSPTIRSECSLMASRSSMTDAAMPATRSSNLSSPAHCWWKKMWKIVRNFIKFIIYLDKHYAITVSNASHECFQIVRSHDATLQKRTGIVLMKSVVGTTAVTVYQYRTVRFSSGAC
jgi:hypothetical protein